MRVMLVDVSSSMRNRQQAVYLIHYLHNRTLNGVNSKCKIAKDEIYHTIVAVMHNNHVDYQEKKIKCFL